jgi:hypothetical protein
MTTDRKETEIQYLMRSGAIKILNALIRTGRTYAYDIVYETRMGHRLVKKNLEILVDFELVKKSIARGGPRNKRTTFYEANEDGITLCNMINDLLRKNQEWYDREVLGHSKKD